MKSLTLWIPLWGVLQPSVVLIFCLPCPIILLSQFTFDHLLLTKLLFTFDHSYFLNVTYKKSGLQIALNKGQLSTQVIYKELFSSFPEH